MFVFEAKGDCQFGHSLSTSNLEGPMTLTKWLKLKPMLASEFAAYMGVSTSAVSRWLNGHRIPRPEQMRMIYVLTKKRVRPQDWYV